MTEFARTAVRLASQHEELAQALAGAEEPRLELTAETEA